MVDPRSELARRQMIDAAERLVAERGLGAVTLRDVQTAAGQRNKSAAVYHFGSRHGLLEAVLTSRMAAVSQRRAELLAEIDRLDGEATMRHLVEALVRPIAEHTVVNLDSHWARFLFQCTADPEVAAIVRRRVEGETYRDVRRRLLAALGHLPEGLRSRRIDHATRLAFMSLAEAEARRDSGAAHPVPLAAEIEDLLDMCVAIVELAPSDATTRHLGSPATDPVSRPRPRRPGSAGAVRSTR